jgi:hypothetical protein
MNNLWILTEERPKKEVLIKILEKVCLDKGFSHKFSNLVIKPLLKDNKFTFTYELIGFSSDNIKRVFIKNVSGNSSFVDFLIFLQNNEPTQKDKPIYAIEETKTDDSESRNTGVYQRCSKFVYVDLYYPDCKKVMLYNLKVNPKKPTETNIFGTRMLLNLEVEIIGKDLDESVFKKFDSIEELIKFKDNMRDAPKGNIPILLSKKEDSIEISGRLWKAGGLSHDPNIGALSLISKTLRELGWKKEIIITKHGLSQKHLTKRNKFVKIANEIGINLEGLKLPKSELSEDYWHYEKNSEKLGTIFIHLILEELKGVRGIYENHAGCERGYFYTEENTPIALHKYIKNNKENGKIPKIPDLIVADDNNKLILNLEGKTSANVNQGLEDIKLFDTVEEEYIKIYYPNYKILRGVVLFGSEDTEINDAKVIFLLNNQGDFIISKDTPEIISKAIKLILNLNKEN